MAMRFAFQSAAQNRSSLKTSSRVNDVNKHGEVRSDRMPVLGNVFVHILAQLEDVKLFAFHDQCDNRFMVP